MAKASEIIRKIKADEEAKAKPKDCPDGKCEGEKKEEEQALPFEEEDFWEAMDMLNSSKNCMRWVLKHCDDGLTISRRRMLEELCDDIGHFSSLFLLEE